MKTLYSFPPAGSAGRILILGSMPGEASLRAGQYYAHPRNLFWPLMGALVGADAALPYEERLSVLEKSGIVVWDVLQTCVREGSLDSAIREESPNDFVAFFAAHPAVSHVFFNGAKAEQSFRRHALGTLKAKPVLHRLPSTSPAHAGMNFQRKLDAWRMITKI